MSGLAAIQEAVRSQLGTRNEYAGAWRVTEITRLVVRHWPHHHLEAAMQAGGQNHRAVEYALTLLKAQVRERWEAEHGIGPLWNLVLGGVVTQVSYVVLNLWWSSASWRVTLRQLSREAA